MLLGAVVGTLLRESLSLQDLQRYGFRIPFLCGFLVALAGLALHKYVPDMSAVEAETGPGNEDSEVVPAALRAQQTAESTTSSDGGDGAASPSAAPVGGAKPNPLKEVFAGHKLELCMGMPVLFLYCTAFYECLVWLAVRRLRACVRVCGPSCAYGSWPCFVTHLPFHDNNDSTQTYLTTLAPHAPIKGAFPINTANLALATLLFPLAGGLAGARCRSV